MHRGRDPVTTVPFALTLKDGPGGLVVERAGPCGCVADAGALRRLDAAAVAALGR